MPVCTFHIMTLFPEMIDAIRHSIMGRALSKGVVGLETYQIRDYSADEKHHKVDDYTYGGGAGMLMAAQPIYDCYKAVLEKTSKSESETVAVYVTPQGVPFTQKIARSLSEKKDIIILCGHYEGVDERVLDEMDVLRISVGDYVLTGGELPAMIIADAVSRLVPGVLNNDESARTESFDNNLLEYQQYTRPEIWTVDGQRQRRVPEILLSGDHSKVDKWRLEQSVLRTQKWRPDLYEKYISENDGQNLK